MLVLDLAAWSTLSQQPVIVVATTVLAYLGAQRLSRWGNGHPLLNPTLLAIVFVVLAINAAGVSYTTYLSGAGMIQFLLGPAVVLLAVPLFRQTKLIRASGGLIAGALAVGLPAGMASGVGIAWLLGGTPQTLLSLAPKSVTAGIAIDVSESIGGIPALTAVLVISTGILGAVFGPIMASILNVSDDRITGLAMGITSHGIATAKALQISETAGAFSSLGMGLNGVLTAMLLPMAVHML